MDFNDTDEEAAFRGEVKAWLARHAPAHEVPAGIVLDDSEEVARGKAWQRELYMGGYAGILLPSCSMRRRENTICPRGRISALD